MARMVIAFDIGPVRPQPTGVGTYARSMARALAESIPDDLVLIGRRRDAKGLPDSVGSVYRRNAPYPAWVVLRAARDGRRAGAQLIHYSDGIVPPVRSGPTIVTVHDLSAVRQWRAHRIATWMRIPLVLGSPRITDRIVVPSQATAAEVMRFSRVAAARIEVVPYAPADDLSRADDADIERSVGKYGQDRGGYILALGTIEPRKNHLRLIAAFEQLVARNDGVGDVRLLIAGKPGWGSKAVLRAASESGWRHRIDLIGYVDQDDIAPLLSGAAAVAYLSTYEGFGLPVIEALRCGAPTVTSNVSSMPEVAGDAGFLVDPYDVSDIRRGLLEAIRSNEASGNVIRRASISQAAKFTWRASAARIVEIYRSMGAM